MKELKEEELTKIRRIVMNVYNRNDVDIDVLWHSLVKDRLKIYNMKFDEFSRQITIFPDKYTLYMDGELRDRFGNFDNVVKTPQDFYVVMVSSNSKVKINGLLFISKFKSDKEMYLVYRIDKNDPNGNFFEEMKRYRIDEIELYDKGHYPWVVFDSEDYTVSISLLTKTDDEEDFTVIDQEYSHEKTAVFNISVGPARCHGNPDDTGFKIHCGTEERFRDNFENRCTDGGFLTFEVEICETYSHYNYSSKENAVEIIDSIMKMMDSQNIGWTSIEPRYIFNEELKRLLSSANIK